MTTEELYSKLSGYSFSLSFLISKLKLLPFPLVSLAFNFIGQILGFAGYAFWYLALLLRPENEKCIQKYDDYSEIVEQHQIASTIGLISSILGVIGIFFPVALIPAACGIFAANIFWVIGESNKLKTPPPEVPNFNLEKQKDHVIYTIAMTAISFVAAVTTTILICFPVIAVPTLVISTIMTLGAGLLAFEYWSRVHLRKDPEKPAIAAQSETATPEAETQYTEPYHGKPLFIEAVKSAPEEQLSYSADPQIDAQSP